MGSVRCDAFLSIGSSVIGKQPAAYINVLGDETTINNEIYTMCGIFTKVIDWGKNSFNPIQKIKRFKIKARCRILDLAEQEALIAAAGC